MTGEGVLLLVMKGCHVSHNILSYSEIFRTQFKLYLFIPHLMIL